MDNIPDNEYSDENRSSDQDIVPDFLASLEIEVYVDAEIDIDRLPQEYHMN